jgi:hypothetical protein
MSSTFCSTFEATRTISGRSEVRVEPDEIDVELRPPQEVRARILILASMLRRIALENAPSAGEGDPIAEAFDEREWLRDQGLTSQLTAPEAALLASPLGSIGPDVSKDVSWQGEALVALAWAIRVLDMPAIDATPDLRQVMDLVPRPWDSITPWMSDPAFVAEWDAVRERERAEIWHWRATTELLRREVAEANRRDYEAAIAEVAAEAGTAGYLPALLDRDFPVRGRSIKEISDSDVDELIAVSGQRLRALNWLCGFGITWNDVPLDV